MSVPFLLILQIISNPTRFATVHLAAERVRLEYVVVIEGTVQLRPDEMVNPNMPTGEVEVRCQSNESSLKHVNLKFV
jgi:aspartyl-tRNA synthetase